jgi:hypothetical protein
MLPQKFQVETVLSTSCRVVPMTVADREIRDPISKGRVLLVKQGNMPFAQLGDQVVVSGERCTVSETSGDTYITLLPERRDFPSG